MISRISRTGADDSGAVAILVAILSVVLFGIAAFAVDLGVAWASKRELSVAVDGAALSGAQAAGLQFPVGQGCDSVVSDMQSAAATAAAATYSKAAPMQTSTFDSIEVSCVDTNGDTLGDVVDVRVTSTATWNTFFAGVLGIDSLNPGATAVARIGGAEAYGGLRPFAICIKDVEELLAGSEGADTNTTRQTEFRNHLDTESTTCGAAEAPGNWGLVDFNGDNGGGNSNPNWEIADWTANGYDGPVYIPDESMPGDPGSDFKSGPVQAALTSIVNDTVLFPVAETWDNPGGNNASFNAVGVVAAKVCGYAISEKEKDQQKGDCWDQALADAVFLDESGGVAKDAPALVIQWRYVNHVKTFGGGNQAEGCDLATDPGCVPTVRLWE